MTRAALVGAVVTVLAAACSGKSAAPDAGVVLDLSAPRDVNRVARLASLGCPAASSAANPPTGPVAYVTHGISDYIAEVTLPGGTAAPTVRRCIDVYRHRYINEPYDVELSADGATLYVVLSHAESRQLGALLAYRISDLSLTGEVPLDTEPSIARLDEARHRAYVTLFRNVGRGGDLSQAGALYAVDTTAMTVVGKVDLCAAALGVDLDLTRHEAYVACFGSNEVSVVDISTDHLAELKRLAIGGTYPSYVAVAGGGVWIDTAGTSQLYRLDPLTRAFTDTLELGVSVTPQRMAVTADGARLYVNLAAGNAIAAIDVTTRKEVGSVATPGLFPEGIALSADASFAVVTDEADFASVGHAAVVRLPSGTVTGAVASQVALGIYPQAVTIRP